MLGLVKSHNLIEIMNFSRISWDMFNLLKFDFRYQYKLDNEDKSQYNC